MTDVSLWRRGLSYQEMHSLYLGTSAHTMAVVGTQRAFPAATPAEIRLLLARGLKSLGKAVARRVQGSTAAETPEPVQV